MTSQNGRAFNEWLRAQLKAKKMSQRQLAQQSGVDHSTISRLIRGDRMPSLGTATKLARGLRELREDADTAAVPRPRHGRGDEPDRPRRVRPQGRRDAERAAGPPDHGVLPRRPDAPLRPRLPAAEGSTRPVRRIDPRLARSRPSVARSWPASGRPHERPALARWVGRWAARAARSGHLTDFSSGHDPDRPPRPGLGDSERRRLGRRPSRFRWRVIGCRAWTPMDCVAACAPRSRTFEVRSLRCSGVALPSAPIRDERSRAVAPGRPSATNAVVQR